jgi:tetratricopeptide (TPR) repeat protein
VARTKLLIVSIAAILAVACGRNEDAQPTERGRITSRGDIRRTLLTVAPPEMSGAEAALQERVRARYASLAAARERSDIADGDLASAYGEVGKLLIAAELLTQAEPYLLNARTLTPGQMAWPYYLGHVHRLRNDREKAIGFFEESLRLRPDYVPALVWLGASHLDRGQPAAADALFQKAVSLQPGSAAARFGLGRAALAAGDYRRATEHLEAALAADSLASRAHYPLAMAYRALGDSRQADAHLRQWERTFSPSDSLKDGQLFPADPLMEEIGDMLQTAVAYETRGIRALDDRKWAEAIAQFREGLKVAPRDETLHQNLGTALFLSGDEELARASFEDAVRLSPGYAKAHFSLGLLMETRGNDQEAIDRFSAAIRHDPTLVDARFRLADGLRRTGRVEQSLAHYQTIVASDPRASQARFASAMALVRLGRYREARAALEEGVQVHPDQPGFAHALARVLAAAPDNGVRDGRRALTTIEGLQKTYGASATLTESLAMALAEVGRFRDAAARQRDAMTAATQQGRADLAQRMADNLRLYESGTACRMPWRDDDPVHVPPRASGLRF